MNNEIILNSNQNKPLSSSESLKDRALLYLEEALILERFEACAGLVQKAKTLGAQQSDIRAVIARYIREVRAGRENEAQKKWGGGRLRF